MKLEFDKIYFIGKIIVYFAFYNNWFGDDDYWHENEEHFRQCVDHHNSVDVSVYQGDVKLEFCGTLKLTYGLEQSDQIYTLICNAAGDTVKFNKKSGAILVYEVVALNEPKGNCKLFKCRPISYQFRGFIYMQIAAMLSNAPSLITRFIMSKITDQLIS